MPASGTLYCTNCRHTFVPEESGQALCPACGWASSLIPASEKDSPVEKTSPGRRHSPLRLHPKILLAAALFVMIPAAVWMGWNYRMWLPDTPPQTGPEPAATPLAPAERLPANRASAGSAVSVPEADRAILEKRVAVPAELVPSEERILNERVVFKTGQVERIPSAAWTREQFLELLEEQQAFFKVRLPRSYRRSLEDLFDEHYVPAAAAFSRGELMGARDSWVMSLAFPVYRNDPERHRGVVLTMLRPFINDTLAKIGAVNSFWVENRIRTLEQGLAQEYEGLLNSLQAGRLDDASAQMDHVEKHIRQLEKAAAVEVQPPAYPPGISRIDRDIRDVLLEMLEPVLPTLADLEGIRSDIREKRRVLNFFPRHKAAAQTELYEKAAGEIAGQEWEQARRTLEQMTPPVWMEDDVRAKLEALQRQLDSA